MGKAGTLGHPAGGSVTLGSKLSQSSMKLDRGAQEGRQLVALVTFQWDKSIKQEGEKDGS